MPAALWLLLLGLAGAAPGVIEKYVTHFARSLHPAGRGAGWRVGLGWRRRGPGEARPAETSALRR